MERERCGINEKEDLRILYDVLYRKGCSELFCKGMLRRLLTEDGSQLAVYKYITTSWMMLCANNEGSRVRYMYLDTSLGIVEVICISADRGNREKAGEVLCEIMSSVSWQDVEYAVQRMSEKILILESVMESLMKPLDFFRGNRRIRRERYE